MSVQITRVDYILDQIGWVMIGMNWKKRVYFRKFPALGYDG